MGHLHLVSEPTILHDANRIGFGAQVVISGKATITMPTTQPWKNHTHITNGYTAGIRSEFADATDHFMPRCSRKHDATVSELHAFPTAHVVIALPEMEVGMADATVRYL
jgi:hypothetical protein